MLEHMPYRRPVKQPLPKRQALFYEKMLEFSNLVGVVLIVDYGLNPEGFHITLFLVGTVILVLFYAFVWYSMNRFY